MSKAKETTEEVPEEEPKTLSIAEKIQKKFEQAKAVEVAAAKEMAELEKLSNIGDDVMTIVNTVAELDKDIGEKKAAFNEAVKPFNESIAAEKTKFDEATKELTEARNVEYTKIVESVGETGAKMLTGKAVSTGTGTGRGRGRGNAKRETAVAAICDEGLTFEEAALKYDHMGSAERPEYTGKNPQSVGHLVKRHLDLSVTEDKTVVKNADGTYSRA